MNTLLTIFLISLSYSQTVVDIAINSPLTTILESAVVNNGLASTLAGTGPFTVFAPTDAAFTALGLNGNNIDAQILLNHVIQANTSESDFNDQQKYITLAGNSYQITFQSSPPAIIDSNSRTISINTTDIVATNGIVHLINGVILPGTIVDYVVEEESLGVLETAAINANLTSTLSSAGPFTLLAPINMSFDAIKTIGLYLADNDKTKLTNLLTYHVIPGIIMAADLTDGIATTVNGNNLTITASTASFTDRTGQTCNVTKADIRRSNGVIHIINCVLRDETIADIVVNSQSHTILGASLTAADLVSTLNGPGPFTVFAPVDNAFTDSVKARINASNTIRDNTLLYHVIGGTPASSTTLFTLNDKAIKTLSNNITLDINITNSILKIQDTKGMPAMVTTPDVYSTNGIVHVTDYVFEYGTVVDYIVGNVILNSLESAIIAADLVTTLSGTGPFTILAPTDAAFANSVVNEYTGDLLKQILNYHFISGKITSDMLVDGETITTLEGRKLRVKIINGDVNFEDGMGGRAMVKKADIITSNGVVYIIDDVLRFPPTTIRPTEDSNSFKLSIMFVITLTMFVFFFLN